MGVSPLTLFNVAGSALRAQQASLDLVANNLANAATPGLTTYCESRSRRDALHGPDLRRPAG